MESNLILSTYIIATHSLFADDTFPFSKSNVNEATHIKYALDLYSKKIGQRINANKFKIFILNTNYVVAQRTSSTLGLPVDYLPSIYLGIPFLCEPTR